MSRWIPAVFCILSLSFLTASRAAHAESYRAGSCEVIILNDGVSEGNRSLLLGASESQIKKYLPGGSYSIPIQYFLARAPGMTALVDTGYGNNLLAALKGLGLGPEDIDALFLTHMHPDHIGGMLDKGRPVFPRAAVYVAERERAYWTDPSTAVKNRAGFTQVKKILAAYGKRTRTFKPGELETQGAELLPGVRAVAAYGHTPGHTMYLVGDETARILIWGDLTHVMDIQTPVPTVAVVYDVNPKEAVATRLKTLRYVSEHNLPVAGMHIAAPGMGVVSADRRGGYMFTPMDTAPEPRTAR